MATLLPFAPVLLRLLQGVVYSEDRAIWELLQTNLLGVQEHLEHIGLRLRYAPEDGYAFLEQPEPDRDAKVAVPLPRLVRRMPLSYSLTLLCVLLREYLDSFDARNPESDLCIISRSEIYDLVNTFYRQTNNVARDERLINADIARLKDDFGFLRATGKDDADPRYQVRRIIRARIDSDVLLQIREMLTEHVGSNG